MNKEEAMIYYRIGHISAILEERADETDLCKREQLIKIYDR